MTVYLPDTNVLIDPLNDKRRRREILGDFLLQGHRLACCSITAAEVYAGMRVHEAPKTDQFLSSLVWYEISREVARRAGRLRFEWARSGMTLALPDTLIAATALQHGLTVLTDDRKDFPMAELSVFPLF